MVRLSVGRLSAISSNPKLTRLSESALPRMLVLICLADNLDRMPQFSAPQLATTALFLEAKPSVRLPRPMQTKFQYQRSPIARRIIQAG